MLVDGFGAPRSKTIAVHLKVASSFIPIPQMEYLKLGETKMSLMDIDLYKLSEANILQLIQNGVPESISIDYKRESYGNKDEDVKEFLKDISSFANTTGGHLLIGIAEENGIPTECRGISSQILEGEKSRYENYCRDCLEPRIVGLKIHSVSLASGSAVIVIRIPRSLNPPHRTLYKNTKRFYARNSTGAFELSVEELRAVFGASQTIQEHVRAFRKDQINKTLSGDTPVDLAQANGTLVIHLIPYSAFAFTRQIDLEKAQSLSHKLRPLGSTSGYSPRINIDGFINIRGGPECYGYTQLHRNGQIEAVKAGVLFERNGTILLGSVDFESILVNSVPEYLQALEQLGFDCPIVVTATLLGVRGAILGIGNQENSFDPPDPIRKENVFFPEIIIEEFSNDENYVRKLKSLIDVLWNAAGRVQSKHLNNNGAWKNPGFQ
jgi:hypothetical protein